MAGEKETATSRPERLVEKGLQPAVVQATPPKMAPGKDPNPPQPSQTKQ